MHKDDLKRLHVIANERDPTNLAYLVHEFYQDVSRAERTSRAQLYLHLDILARLILDLAASRDRQRAHSEHTGLDDAKRTKAKS